MSNLRSQGSYHSVNRRHERQYFYKYMSAATAKIVMTTRKLRWSSPIIFNDPFDVTQELRLNFDADELNAAVIEQFAVLLEKGAQGPVRQPVVAALLSLIDTATAETRASMAREFRQESPASASIGQVASHNAVREMWRSIVPKFRTLCLSERRDVTPMWLHYSDTYRGVVLQFEALDEVDSSLLVARPVVYQDAPPAIAEVKVWAKCMLGLTDFTIDDLFTEYEYVKTSEWSHEHEWRIASLARPGESGHFSDYGFHPLELAAVYFGPNCSPEDRSDISALLTHGLEHVQRWDATHDLVAGRFSFTETGA